jgi:hypothetical protein
MSIFAEGAGKARPGAQAASPAAMCGSAAMCRAAQTMGRALAAAADCSAPGPRVKSTP